MLSGPSPVPIRSAPPGERTPDRPRVVQRWRLGWTPPLDFSAFRRQETVQILLNMAVMAGLMSLHAIFQPVIGPVSGPMSAAFGARFAMQLAEAGYLHQRGRALSPRATWWYARLSIVANIGFTVIVARLASGQESHLTVLMVLPVIAASYRLSLPGLLATLAVVCGLTVGLVWIPTGSSAPATTLTESFEATTVALIFLVVAGVVRLLAMQVWAQEDELRESLRALAATQDQLVRQEKLAAVGRLASAVAHEVRNPVSMIASAVASARRPGLEPDAREELFGILGQETQRLERLTEDFLVYARARPPQRRPTSLSDALGLVTGLVRARAEALGIVLDTHCGDAPVRVDPFQLQQALLNLALNALEATPRGGAVTLSARSEPGGGVFAVENTGAPLPMDVVARLGEPFFTTKRRGTGLGLAIAQSIAAAHGGEVLLATNGPDRVRFELRVRSGEEQR